MCQATLVGARHLLPSKPRTMAQITHDQSLLPMSKTYCLRTPVQLHYPFCQIQSVNCILHSESSLTHLWMNFHLGTLMPPGSGKSSLPAPRSSTLLGRWRHPLHLDAPHRQLRLDLPILFVIIIFDRYLNCGYFHVICSSRKRYDFCPLLPSICRSVLKNEQDACQLSNSTKHLASWSI